MCRWWECLCASDADGAAFDGGIRAGIGGGVVLCTARDCR